MPAASFTQITHIQGQLVITIDATALQPSLLEQAQQPAVVKRAVAFWLGLPGVVTAGMPPEHAAHSRNAVDLLMPGNKGVLQPD